MMKQFLAFIIMALTLSGFVSTSYAQEADKSKTKTTTTQQEDEEPDCE